eukprot:TRINITY_DN15819_c0_g1_i2.p1 TRINITY_DN15819_c0_g1~~TRINITY_DN15819_c0_g1_i2.p1  ORF type:complete len:424 (+),score=179.49 TRINITY_DN15819_c0_g1_i2:74-1345(+)
MAASDDFDHLPRGFAAEDVDVPAQDNPRILLMGMRKSGKTSIQKVVFEKQSPHDTLMLETSAKVSQHPFTNMSFVQFQIMDFPGQLMELAHSDEDDTNLSSLLVGSGAVVFVIDCTDNWPPSEASRHLVQTILKVRETPAAQEQKFEVFIHKVDCLKQEVCKDRLIALKLQIEEELNFAVNERCDKGDDPSGRLRELRGCVREFLATNVFYHLTSIFDHSVFDAFSKVVQRVIANLHDCIRELLGMLVQNSVMEKAYLFDVVSKIHIAQDSNEVSEQVYEICFDMIDIAIEFSKIYGTPGQDRSQDAERPPAGSDQEREEGDEGRAGEDHGAPGACGTSDMHHDGQSAAVIKLESNRVLYLRGVNKSLALVCLLREENYKKIGLINYNVMQFKKLLREIFQTHEENAARRRELQYSQNPDAMA